MRIRRTIILPLLTAGGLVTLTACGGGADTLSAESFATEMDDICAAARDDFDAIDEPTDDAGLARALDETIDVSKQAIADMEALPLDGARAKDRDEIVDILNEANEHLADGEAAAADGDDDAVERALDDYTASLTEFRAAARSADLENCATEPTDTDEPDATDVPATTAPPVTVPVTPPPTSGGAADQDIDYIDATQILTPWESQQLLPLTEADAQALVAEITSDPESVQFIVAVGAAQAVDPATGDGSVLVFVEFSAELTPVEIDRFVAGVTSGAETTVVDANGLPGYAYTATDGTFGFTSVRAATGVVIVSPTDAALVATVEGLFTSNPEL